MTFKPVVGKAYRLVDHPHDYVGADISHFGGRYAKVIQPQFYHREDRFEVLEAPALSGFDEALVSVEEPVVIDADDRHVFRQSLKFIDELGPGLVRVGTVVLDDRGGRVYVKVPDSPRRAARTFQACCRHLSSFRPTRTSADPGGPPLSVHTTRVSATADTVLGPRRSHEVFGVATTPCIGRRTSSVTSAERNR